MRHSLLVLCVVVVLVVLFGPIEACARMIEPLAGGKHFMIRLYPGCKAFYQISYADVTLGECMQALWEQAGISTVAFVPDDGRTEEYFNNSDLKREQEHLALDFGLCCHRHGRVAALVTDKTKPLMAGKPEVQAAQPYAVEHSFSSRVRKRVAIHLAASFTQEQLALNRKGGIPLDALTKDQLEQVRFLASSRQLIDPFDTRPRDSLANAKARLYLIPGLRFRNVEERYRISGWSTTDVREREIRAGMKNHGQARPLTSLSPDPRFDKEVTVVAPDITLSDLLDSMSSQIGVPLRVDQQYADLRLHAFCKAKASDMWSAISDVTGLGSDKVEAGWVLRVNEWARVVADWRLRYVYGPPPYDSKTLAKLKSVLRDLAGSRKLPILADKEWAEDDRIYSLVENQTELGYSELTPQQQEWLDYRMRIWAKTCEVPEDELLQDINGWKYSFKPLMRLWIANERALIYGDWVNIE